jgi:hypothetical protein
MSLFLCSWPKTVNNAQSYLQSTICGSHNAPHVVGCLEIILGYSSSFGSPGPIPQVDYLRLVQSHTSIAAILPLQFEILHHPH